MNFVTCPKKSLFPKSFRKIIIFTMINIQFKNDFMGHLIKMALMN